MAFIVLPHRQRRIRVGKIVALGRNYAAHAREMGARPSHEPVLFLKPSTSLTGPGCTVARQTGPTPLPLPAFSENVHHEVEIVLAIGRRCKNASLEEAARAVIALTVGLDLTARDLQNAAKRQGHPWSVSKGFDASAPVAPFVPWDESDHAGKELRFSLHVNGSLRQEGSTLDMLCGLVEAVAYCSRFFTLEVGDLIFTGTPSGVAPLASGDRLVVELEGLTKADFIVE